jgi:hypothetical protein
MVFQSAYADVEIRILAKDATGYPVEITVQTATGRQEFEGGHLNLGGGPGVAGAGYAHKQYGMTLFNWLFADPTLRNHWTSISSEHKRRRRIAVEAPEIHQYPWESLPDEDASDERWTKFLQDLRDEPKLEGSKNRARLEKRFTPLVAELACPPKTGPDFEIVFWDNLG